MALQEVGVKLVLDPGSFYADLGKANDAVGQIGNKASEGGGGFNALEQVAIGSLRRIGEAAINAGAQIVAGIGKGVADSVSAAANFEGAVNNLAAVSGTALEDAGFSFDDVSQKALQLGVDTAYSASQSIAAMTELVKGGVPVAQVMAEATDHTLALAAAANIELGPAAEIVAKQFGVWADTGVTTAQVVDTITQAANASTVGAEDLALGLAQAGGTAKTAGVEFGDLVQSMALISPNFSSASDAGTSFKTFLTRLIPSTKPATEQMIALGLATEDGKSKFYDAAGSFIGMEQAAALLQAQTASLTEEQRLSAFQTIFGADAIRAASAIATAGAEGFNAMGTSMASAGSAAETAAIQNQGFDFAMDQLKGTLETIQIVIGTALLPILTQFLQGTILPGLAIVAQFAQALTGNQEALAALSPPLQQAVTVLQNIVGAFTSAGPMSQEFAASLGGISPMLPPIVSGIQQVVSFLENNWQSAVAVAGAAFAALLVPALMAGAAAFAAAVVAAAPVIAVLAVVGAAAAALKGAWDSNFGGIQEKTAAAMAAIQSVIQSVLTVVMSFWNRNGAEIMATAQRTWAQVQQIVGTVVAIVAEIVTRVFGTIAAFLNEHGATIQRVLDFAWNNVKSIIELVMGVIQGIVTTVLGIITGDWEKAGEGIGQIVGNMAKFVRDSFNNLLSLIKDLGPKFIAGAKQLGQGIIDGIKGAIANGGQAIRDALMSLAKGALDAAKKALGISSPSRVFALEVGTPIALGVAEGIIAGIPNVLGAIEILGGEAKDKAIKTFEDIGNAAATAMDDAIGGQLGFVRTRQSTLKEFGKFQDELDKLGETRGESAAAEAQFQRLYARVSGADQLRVVAQNEARKIAEVDAQAGADYLALREQQIVKILELEGERDKAVTKNQIARANQTLAMEREAQELELQQFKLAMDKRAKETAALGKDAELTGSAVIDGMILGIQERSQELSAALSTVMADALKAAQQSMGIASPSKLFAVEVGRPISEGIALGIQQAMPVAMGAVNDMAGALIRPAAPSMGRGGSSVSNVTQNFNYSPQYNGAPRAPHQDFAALRALSVAR